MTPLAPYSAAPAKGWQPWGLLTPLLAFLFVVVPFAPVELTLQHFGLLDPGEAPVGMTGFLAFLLLPFGLIGLIVLGWTRFVERRSSATIGLTRTGRAGGFLRGLAVGWAMTAAIVAAIWASGGVQAAGIAPAFGSPTALLDILLLLAGFAVQASVEEITFRGWLFSAAARKLNVPIAIFLTASVFTLLHYERGQAPLFTLTVILYSVFACLWAWRAGSIWAVMGWHTGWNWLLAVGFELRVTGLDAHQPGLLMRFIPTGPIWLTGGAEGPEGSLFTPLLLAGAIAWLLLSARRRETAPDDQALPSAA